MTWCSKIKKRPYFVCVKMRLGLDSDARSGTPGKGALAQVISQVNKWADNLGD